MEVEGGRDCRENRPSSAPQLAVWVTDEVTLWPFQVFIGGVQTAFYYSWHQVFHLVSAAWSVSVLHPGCNSWGRLAVAPNPPARPAIYVRRFNIKLPHLARDTPIHLGHANVDRKFRTIRACVEINANGFFKESSIQNVSAADVLADRLTVPQTPRVQRFICK